MLRLRSLPPLFSSLLLLLLACPSSVFAATTLATFYDDACQESYNGFSGPDGFPNGTCTDLDQANGGAFKSFQVVELDPGCAVTIYDNNTSEGPCSPVVLQLADLARCYNTTWTYYSIDGCTAPSSSTSSSSPTPSASGSARRKEKNHHTGTVVGAVVGAIAAAAAAAAAIASLAFFLLRRRRRRRAAQMGSSAAGTGPPAELPHDGAVSEMGAGLGHPHHGSHEMHSPAIGYNDNNKNAEMEAVVPSEMGGGIEGRTRDEVEQEKMTPVEMEGDARWVWEGRGGAREDRHGGDGSVGTHETRDEKDDRKRWSWER